MYTLLVRPLLFLFRPELIHKLVLMVFNLPFINNLISIFYTYGHPSLEKTVLGLKFPNIIGLAAGFDKNAEHINSFSAMGFGFIEIGTVTPLAQPGNPKPRLFRLKQDKAIINRMGFNNNGLTEVICNIRKANPTIIIGGNMGKNKITQNEDAVTDYLKCFDGLFTYVDYFVVNVSSPNTPGLRELQDKQPLTHLLNRLQLQNEGHRKRKPILLKIAPDLTNDQLDDIIEIVKETKIDGIVATNTTITRSGLKTSLKKIQKIGNGGLSGKPVFKRSNEIIQYIRSKSDMVIIGVGGIMKPQDAFDKIKAGADLIQIYTGLIYEGPGLLKRIKKDLIK